MEKMVNSLKYKNYCNSHLGCIKGGLEFLKVDISDAWLFGGTGYAFIFNMNKMVYASCLKSWNSEIIGKLGNNLGFFTGEIWGYEPGERFEMKQKAAWDKIRENIDMGVPTFSWGMDKRINEFYLVCGYNDEGYYYDGPLTEAGASVLKHNELGNPDYGLIDVKWIEPAYFSDDINTLKEALAFAVDFNSGSKRWVFERYKSGYEAYDLWIDALKGEIDSFGMRYNVAGWGEARRYAMEFFIEAEKKIGGKYKSVLYDTGLVYREIFEGYSALKEIYPLEYSGTVEKRDTAIKILGEIKQNEEKAQELIKKIITL